MLAHLHKLQCVYKLQTYSNHFFRKAAQLQASSLSIRSEKVEGGCGRYHDLKKRKEGADATMIWKSRRRAQTVGAATEAVPTKRQCLPF